MSDRLRRLPRLAVLAGGSLLLFLLLLEGTLRALRPLSPGVRDWLMVPHDLFDYDRAGSTAELLEMSLLGHHPFVDQGGFVTNSRGFRTPEYEVRKAPGTWRIVALGDSFTFASGGVPWGDLWTTQLAARLAGATTRTVELINLGVPAVGPSFELRLWQLEGAALQADLVLLALYVGNDFADEIWSVEGSIFSAQGRASCTARLLRNLVRGRERVGWRKRVLPTPAGTVGGYPVEGYERIYAELAPCFSAEQLARVQARHMWICDRSTPRQFEQLSGRVSDAVRRLNSAVDAAGARLAVLLIPVRAQVYPADRAAALAAAGRPESDFDWDRPQRRLADFLQAEGIPFLDLLPVLSEAAAMPVLYTPGDTHWSPAGNALVAERIAAWAATQGWPPGGVR